MLNLLRSIWKWIKGDSDMAKAKVVNKCDDEWEFSVRFTGIVKASTIEDAQQKVDNAFVANNPNMTFTNMGFNVSKRQEGNGNW